MNTVDYLVVHGLLNWQDVSIVDNWIKENCPSAYTVGGGWIFENKEELMLFKIRFNPKWIAGND